MTIRSARVSAPRQIVGRTGVPLTELRSAVVTTGPRGELLWPIGTLNPGEQITAQLELMPVAEGEIGSVASVSFRAANISRGS